MDMTLLAQRVVVVVFVMNVMPGAAHALTSADIDAQIQLLLQQVTTLQTKIQQYSNTQTTPTTPTTSVIPVTTTGQETKCPILERTLSLGARGTDVTDLQYFLFAEELISQSSITGTYDVTTENAVGRWQASHGIVSSGNAVTTGYGAVGPRTRALIALNCSLGPQTITLTPRTANDPAPASCPVAPKPATSCSAGWKAVTDYYGCTTSYTCSTLSGSGGGSSTTSSTSSSGSGQLSIISPVAGLTIRPGNFLYIAWRPGNVSANYVGLDLVTETGIVTRSIAVLPGSTATTYHWWTIPTGINGMWPGKYKIRVSLQTAAATYCATTAGCSVFKTAESGVFTVQ